MSAYVYTYAFMHACMNVWRACVPASIHAHIYLSMKFLSHTLRMTTLQLVSTSGSFRHVHPPQSRRRGWGDPSRVITQVIRPLVLKQEAPLCHGFSAATKCTTVLLQHTRCVDLWCRALERSCLYTLPNGRVRKSFSAYPFTRSPATHRSCRPSRGRSEVPFWDRSDIRRVASRKAANRECLSVTIPLVSDKISVLALDDRESHDCAPCASPGRSRHRHSCPSDIRRCCWCLPRPANLASMSGGYCSYASRG